MLDPKQSWAGASSWLTCVVALLFVDSSIQRFEIEYQNRHLFHLGLEIYFDGVLLRRVVSHSGEDGIFQGVAIGNGLIKPFAFSALDTTGAHSCIPFPRYIYI